MLIFKRQTSVFTYACIFAQLNICVSEPEQMLHGGGEVSSCADEGPKVCLSVSEAHRAQLLQFLLELLTMYLTGQSRRVNLSLIVIKWSYLRSKQDVCLWEWKLDIKCDKTSSGSTAYKLYFVLNYTDLMHMTTICANTDICLVFWESSE